MGGAAGGAVGCGCGRAGLRQYLLRSAFLGALALVVDTAEVGHDHRDGQSDHQHSAQGADGTHDLPHDGLRNHVSVPAQGGTLE